MSHTNTGHDRKMIERRSDENVSDSSITSYFEWTDELSAFSQSSGLKENTLLFVAPHATTLAQRTPDGSRIVFQQMQARECRGLGKRASLLSDATGRRSSLYQLPARIHRLHDLACRLDFLHCSGKCNGLWCNIRVCLREIDAVIGRSLYVDLCASTAVMPPDDATR
jgi:hypothetical protein